MSDRSSSKANQFLSYVTCEWKLLQCHVVRVDLIHFFCLECFQCYHEIVSLVRSGREICSFAVQFCSVNPLINIGWKAVWSDICTLFQVDNYVTFLSADLTLKFVHAICVQERWKCPF